MSLRGSVMTRATEATFFSASASIILAKWGAAAESIDSSPRKSARTRKPGATSCNNSRDPLRDHLCFLGRDFLRSADHQQAFRLVELNRIHAWSSHEAGVVASVSLRTEKCRGSRPPSSLRRDTKAATARFERKRFRKLIETRQARCRRSEIGN